MKPSSRVFKFLDENFCVDGTREVLSDMEERYHNLRTFEREFDGFGNNRSFALEKGRGSKLRYALFLDADERLYCWEFLF